MSEETYKELVEYAANEGYDVSKLHKTEQVPGVGEGEGENTDRHGAWWLKSLFKK
jgi:apolipoprotein D and lipocalin family protein